jgi:hypothetical protein
MSAAVPSLTASILCAACRTGTRVPAGTSCKDRLRGALTASVTVSSWSQDTRPAVISPASAPSTNSLNIDSMGRAVEDATWWMGVQVPPGDTWAARKPASGASAARSRSTSSQLPGGG